jgi:hypothetical protein
MSLGVPPLHEKQAPHSLCGACSLEVPTVVVVTVLQLTWQATPDVRTSSHIPLLDRRNLPWGLFVWSPRLRSAWRLSAAPVRLRQHQGLL